MSRGGKAVLTLMKAPSQNDITVLLKAWSEGDGAALEALTPLVHAELHRLARTYMSRERPGHMLQTTALIHEAYVRLIDWKNVEWQNRAHFFGVAAGLMRRILVDYARSRKYQKRSGGKTRVSLDEAAIFTAKRSQDFVALDEALKALECMDPRKSQTVELRFFGGLSVEETAQVLNVSARTVTRDWNLARAWLYRELTGPQGG
jgi:RNA polymerase sigma factor (TIGR02999 family)